MNPVENKASKEIVDRGVKKCPHCGASLKDPKIPKRKRWYDRTSITLCVAGGLIVMGFGFIHVVTGVVSPYQLPFDVVLKATFGYRETFVNAEKIKALPYDVAKLRYPLGCKALQQNNYLEFGDAFEAKMTRRHQDNIEQWLEDFDKTLGKPKPQWQDQLLERPQVGLIAPEDPNAYNDRGIAAAREGRYETALALFTRAFQRDPVFAEPYFNRGLVSVAIGLLGQGVSDFSQFIEIKPGKPEGYGKRGSLHLAMKQYDEAISDFTRIVELDPASAQAMFRRSLAYYAKNRYDQAWEDVHRIQNLGFSVPPGYLEILRLVSEANK
ncbi:MAG: tetratricopeptide repeat protein [Sedimentisphaerales bacterium]|nr:tetratricopeptide repeat protein [Sedimentisphaerales bacterium]